jgi:hypothetical protein
MNKSIYLITVLIAFVLFGVMNYYSFVRMNSGFCADCLMSFGFPFPLWEEGGFVTIRRIRWSGLIADFYLALSVGLLMGWAYQKIMFDRTYR